jgi:hypothetical protein
VLSKVVQGGGAMVGSSDTITVTASEGWETALVTVGGATVWVIFNIQTIDLSGYTREQKTVFPQGIMMQDMSLPPTLVTSATCERLTIVSTTPLSESDFTILSTSGSNQFMWPGTANSKHDLQHVLSARLQYYVTLTTLSGLQQVSETTWGAGDSTAANKLWMADVYVIPNTENGTIFLQEHAYVIPALIGKEPDLEYIMRLSRSTVPIQRS